MKPFTILAYLASVASVPAQQPSPKLAFEVASIRLTDPDPASRIQMIGMKADGDNVHYTNITLRDCIRAAYRVRDFQIEGPDWMASTRFEISAKLPAGASMDRIPEMMQSLLAERFGMTIQRGTKSNPSTLWCRDRTVRNSNRLCPQATTPAPPRSDPTANLVP